MYRAAIVVYIIKTLVMMSLALRGNRWRLPRWQLPRARGNASAVRPGPAGSTSNSSESMVRYQLLKKVNAENEA